MPQVPEPLVSWTSNDPVIEHITLMKPVHLVVVGGVRGTITASDSEMQGVEIIRRSDGIVITKPGAHLCDVVGNANIAATREHYSVTYAEDPAQAGRVQAPDAVPDSGGQVRQEPYSEAAGGVSK